MKAIVEFCTNNMHHGTDRIVRKLEEEHPEVDVVEHGCLGNCGQCYVEPYALVNGKIVAAETVDELYEKILEELNSDDDPFAFVDDLD